MRKLTLLVFLLLSLNLSAEGIKQTFYNNKSVDLVQAEELAKASQVLHQLLTKQPDLLIPKLNLAGIYEFNQDYEQALALLSELEEAIEKIATKNPKLDEELRKLLYVSKFNQAYVLALNKDKRKEAVFKYYEALQVYPEDLASKFNIELLTQNNQQQSKQNENSESEEQNKEDKDQKGDGQDKKQQNQPQDQKQQKKQKPKFKENELKKQDVRRIFEELKRQEEKIRAKVNRQKVQEREIEKDW
jgi:tetratricopeptide (TPR) repeat protein